jgi:hypothetical protein
MGKCANTGPKGQSNIDGTKQQPTATATAQKGQRTIGKRKCWNQNDEQATNKDEGKMPMPTNKLPFKSKLFTKEWSMFSQRCHFPHFSFKLFRPNFYCKFNGPRHPFKAHPIWIYLWIIYLLPISLFISFT